MIANRSIYIFNIENLSRNIKIVNLKNLNKFYITKCILKFLHLYGYLLESVDYSEDNIYTYIIINIDTVDKRSSITLRNDINIHNLVSTFNRENIYVATTKKDTVKMLNDLRVIV